LLSLSVLTGAGIRAAVNQIPAPKNLAEAEKLMRVTLHQQILPPGANPAMLEKMLEIGEVILFYDHPKEIPWMSAAGILIQAPPELVYQVVMDHPRYSQYVPMNQGIEDRRLFGNVYQETLHINVKLAAVNYQMDYGLYSYRQAPFRVDWTLAWGEFDRNLGFWELIPSADRKKTMAFYSVYAEPRSKFVKMIYARDPALELVTNVSTATMIVQAMKSEAEKRQGFKSLVPKPLSGMEIDKILGADPVSMWLFLERGDLLILESGPTVNLIAGSLVAAEIQDAYRVITDFKSYPQFVPGVKKVSYLGKSQAGESYQWSLEFDMIGFQYRQVQDLSYQFSPPGLVSWQIPRPCCGAAPGFWKLIPIGNKTIVFNSTTADIRSMGRIPRYALSAEPTLEYATLASQGVLMLNSLKPRIQKKAKD